MTNIRVYNMTSAKGNTIPNQFEIDTPDGTYFQSYRTTIAFKPNKGKIQLDKDRWHYSSTTGKYRNQFLGEGIAETRKKIADGTYILTDLN